MAGLALETGPEGLGDGLLRHGERLGRGDVEMRNDITNLQLIETYLNSFPFFASRIC